MQVDGKKILVDPVFSVETTPITFNIQAFKGTDIYTTQDMPEIDPVNLLQDLPGCVFCAGTNHWKLESVPIVILIVDLLFEFHKVQIYNRGISR